MNLDISLLQAIGAIASPIVALIGFILIYRQVKQVERSTLGGTYGALYSQQNSITRFFIDNPSIRPYFYNNKELNRSDTDYDKVMAVAEMFGDFFEHIYLQRINLPTDIWVGWYNYMTSIHRNSPALRSHFSENRTWYGERVVKLLEYGESISK